MSRSAEVIMYLLLSVVVVIGFAAVVVLGALSVARDLLALTRHRPPSVFDALHIVLRRRCTGEPLMTDAQAKAFPCNSFDQTKVWPKAAFPFEPELRPPEDSSRRSAQRILNID
jgi:hypothetical protein